MPTNLSSPLRSAGIAVLAGAAMVVLTLAACRDAGGKAPADQGGAAVLTALGTLPNESALKRQILIADLARLRGAYPGRGSFRRALAGIWLPDALAGADQELWPRAYGFGLEDVDRFVAGGFHPQTLMVAEGQFIPGQMNEH